MRNLDLRDGAPGSSVSNFCQPSQTTAALPAARMLVFQTREDLVQYASSPSGVRKSASAVRCIRRFEIGTARADSIRPMASTRWPWPRFNCHRTVAFVGQKMLERREQIRTQSSFLFANCIEIPALQQQRKKTLG